MSAEIVAGHPASDLESEVVRALGPAAPRRQPAQRTIAVGATLFGLVALAATIVVTGGARSALIPAIALPSISAGFLAGRRSLPVILGSVAFLVAIFAVELTGSSIQAPLPALGLGLTASLAAALGSLVLGSVRRELEQRRDAAERAHAEAVREVSERHRELVEVAGALAHELKNPLSAVLGLGGLLERKLPNDPELAALVRDIRSANASVHELLDFSRPVSESSLKRIALAPLLEAVGARIAVSVAIEGERSAEVIAEPRKLDRVLDALLRTCARATTVRANVTHVDARVVIDLATDVELSDEPEPLLLARALAEQHGANVTLSFGPRFSARVSWPAASTLEPT